MVRIVVREANRQTCHCVKLTRIYIYCAVHMCFLIHAIQTVNDSMSLVEMRVRVYACMAARHDPTDMLTIPHE